MITVKHNVRGSVLIPGWVQILRCIYIYEFCTLYSTSTEMHNIRILHFVQEKYCNILSTNLALCTVLIFYGVMWDYGAGCCTSMVPSWIFQHKSEKINKAEMQKIKKWFSLLQRKCLEKKQTLIVSHVKFNFFSAWNFFDFLGIFYLWLLLYLKKLIFIGLVIK